CRVHDKRQLGALVGFGDWVARDRRGKTALRADRETIEVDELRRLSGAALERVEAFQRRQLAADEAKNHALFLREAQRCEIAGALGVVFEQEVIDPRLAEEALGNRLVAT